MKPSSTTASRKTRKRAKNDAIHPHKNRKKFRTQPSAGKVMLTLFWDERLVILKHYMPRGNTVPSATYADLLKNHLLPAFKSKRRGRLNTGVLLQHDNARPHTARSTVSTMQDLSSECVPHPPDLAPSDFHVFGPLKKAMGGRSFRSYEEVRQAVQEWLHSQPRIFFRYPCTSEVLEHFYGTQWRLRRKMMSLCSLCV